MRKIKTLFEYEVDKENHKRIFGKLRPEASWIFDSNVCNIYIKLDGTACYIHDFKLYKRYHNKKNKPVPEDWISCGETLGDKKIGIYWIPVKEYDPNSKYHLEAFQDFKKNLRNSKSKLRDFNDKSFELIGEKFQGNPEQCKNKIVDHLDKALWLHTYELEENKEGLFKYLKEKLIDLNREGIIFYNTETKERFKWRLSYYGLKRVNLEQELKEGVPDLIQ